MIKNASQTATYILADENSFYYRFERDLLEAKNEVIIESLFITRQRMKTLTPIFKTLINKGVKIYVITRNPKEHQKPYAFRLVEKNYPFSQHDTSVSERTESLPYCGILIKPDTNRQGLYQPIVQEFTSLGFNVISRFDLVLDENNISFLYPKEVALPVARKKLVSYLTSDTSSLVLLKPRSGQISRRRG